MVLVLVAHFIIANRALALGNYTYLLGREIFLTKFNPEFMKNRAVGNIFVKNLPPSALSADLHKFFQDIGPIFSCRVKYSSNGQCMGYGYVRFENQADADKALIERNGKPFMGNNIEICAFQTRENRSNGYLAYNNLCVQNIPKNYTNADLTRLFLPFGEVISAVVIKAVIDSEENKGFGFVCFKDTEAARKAEAAMNRNLIAGQEIRVCRAMPMDARKSPLREERQSPAFKENNLYVKNLPEAVTEEGLKKAFEEFGTVLSARVMNKKVYNNATGVEEPRAYSFGFVYFETKEAAAKAVEAAKSKTILGQKLYVSVAERKEERNSKYKYNNKHPYQRQPYQMQYPMNPHYNQMRPMMPPDMRPSYPMYYGMPQQYYPMRPMMMPPMAQPPQYSVPPVQAPPPQVAPPALPNDKEQLGEILYPLVNAINETHASKITGMLLELDIEQIHKLVTDTAELRKWVDEAFKVLFIFSFNSITIIIDN